MGGSPTRSWKRRASAARDTPADAARPATVHGSAGWWWISRSARPTTGSAWAWYQAGGSASGRDSQARNAAMSSRSSSRSSTTSSPGSSLTISALSTGNSGQSQVPWRRTISDGSTLSSRRLISPSVVYVPVSIMAAPSARLPHVRTPRAMASLMLTPSGVVQRWPGWITIWGGVSGRSATVYGAGPRMMATSPGPSDWGAPRRARSTRRRARRPPA